MIGTWLLLLSCGWLAATISGVAGFGGAILLLPVLVLTLGGKSAVPILTVAQLLGNLSRAGFGWRDIRWRPALLFSAGAVPASIIGSRLFVELDTARIPRLIGLLLLAILILRHTWPALRRISPGWLAPAGAGVGFVSAVAGVSGPLGAAIFLSLELPAAAYVASEAVTAVFMHATKAMVYGRYAALTRQDLLRGLLLGSSLVAGSWTGRRIITALPEKRFVMLVEALLVVSAFTLLLGV